MWFVVANLFWIYKKISSFLQITFGLSQPWIHFATVKLIDTGTQEASQTWGARRFKGTFVLKKKGACSKHEKGTSLLIENLGGARAPSAPRFLRLCSSILHATNFQICETEFGPLGISENSILVISLIGSTSSLSSASASSVLKNFWRPVSKGKLNYKPLITHRDYGLSQSHL